MKQSLQAYIDKILESEEYREYARLRDLVKQDAQLREQINEFRIRNFEMQMSADTVFEKIESFERTYEDFWENPLVADFLEAELAFCRMMQRNNTVIMEAIDFD